MLFLSNKLRVQYFLVLCPYVSDYVTTTSAARAVLGDCALTAHGHAQSQHMSQSPGATLVNKLIMTSKCLIPHIQWGSSTCWKCALRGQTPGPHRHGHRPNTQHSSINTSTPHPPPTNRHREHRETQVQPHMCIPMQIFQIYTRTPAYICSVTRH